MIFVRILHYGLDPCLVVVLCSSASQNAASMNFHFDKIVCVCVELLVLAKETNHQRQRISASHEHRKDEETNHQRQRISASHEHRKDVTQT